jgi:hypothetical protein
MQVSEAHCQCGWVGHPRQLDAHIRLDHRVGEPPPKRPGFRAALDHHKRSAGHGLTFKDCQAAECLAYWDAVGR